MTISARPMESGPAQGAGRLEAVPRAGHYRGLQLFANSFRPFFLFGAVHAAVVMLVWLPVFYGGVSLTSAFAPRDWHVHEMLYGYLPAAITRLFFTAKTKLARPPPVQ